jgi:hypothetical protein
MTKVTIPGFLHAQPALDWETGPDVVDGHRLYFMTHEDMSDHGYVMVCPYTIEFTMPEGWDPRAQQIEALRKKKAELTREFSEAVMKIEAQISRLQAIEYDAPPAREFFADEGQPFA